MGEGKFWLYFLLINALIVILLGCADSLSGLLLGTVGLMYFTGKLLLLIMIPLAVISKTRGGKKNRRR